MKNFSEFQFSPQLNRALTEMQFSTPTPIQAQTIPLALEGRDVIGCAQTGTGKTAAFLLPLIVRLSDPKQDKKTQALILVPTRELAEQVYSVAQKLLKYVSGVRPALIIGGASMREQTRRLQQSPRVLIATPGRLIDHLQHGLKLDAVQFLVLDEADRMLDMGFGPQIDRIRKQVSQNRQSLMFSATLPPKIRALASATLKTPAQVTVGNENQAAPLIDQKTLNVSHEKKNDIVLDELNTREGSVLIFARTKSRTFRLTKYLESYGFKVEQIHGDRTQAQRKRAIDGFRQGQIRILVATDIAARGIDVTHVAHVINYDLPMDPDDYVHRIGRTGRNGRTGQALSLITPEDKTLWNSIARKMGHKVEPDPSRRLPPRFGGRHEKPSRPSKSSKPFASGRPTRETRGAGPSFERPSKSEPRAAQKARPTNKSAYGQKPAFGKKPGFGQRPGQGRFAGGQRPPQRGHRAGQSARARA